LNHQAQPALKIVVCEGAILQEYFVYFKKSQRTQGASFPQNSADGFEPTFPK